MQGIEKTLRDTLAKLGQPDSAARQKLYQATETILERSLAAFSESQPDMVAARRSELKAIIDRIENDYAAPDIDNPWPQGPGAQDTNVSAVETHQSAPDIIPSQASATSPDKKGIAPEIRTDAPIDSLPDAPIPKPEIAPELDPEKAPEPIIVDKPATPDPIEMMSAPDIQADKRAARNTYVEWPDAATHPDGPSEIEQEFPASDLPEDQSGQYNEALPVEPDVPVVDKKALKKERAAQKKAERLERKRIKREKRRRGSFIDAIASSVVSAILVIFLVVGAWYFVESEYYDMLVEWQSGEQAAPASSELAADDQDFIPKPLNEDAEQVGDWFEIFGQPNLENVQGRGEVLVETIGDSDTGGVRITSVNSSEFGEALIPLDGQRLLGAERNKLALAFSISAEAPTQIYIRCFLKNGVEMDRRRFQLNGGRNELIVNLDMTDVQNFDARPFVTINSDIVGQGRSVELYDIKYQIVE